MAHTKLSNFIDSALKVLKKEYYVTCLLTLISQYTIGQKIETKICDLDSLRFCKLNVLKYDTIKGDFLFENSIASYLDGDAITKSGGYIAFDSNIINSYNKGIYIIGDSYIKNIAERNDKIDYDATSISDFQYKCTIKSINDGSYYGTTKFNPFCGLYYKKYKLNIVVLDLGNVMQKIPLFKTCKELEIHLKNKSNSKYKMKAIPTFIITKVVEFYEYK